MSSDVAISVKNLTKTYRIFNHPGDRIRQAFTLGRMKFHKEFTALKDVSFEIKKGETVGIIGCNGSGKSTLLQLICGILKPTSGSVTVNGRISALLELGAGFNPEFTGRENIYFQGAIMGFSKEEMDARIEDIIAFADIGEFIDQPIWTYSSGMYVRLAFAVAVNTSPGILVIDEALAVGDARFQAKCFGRLSEMRDTGVTIILVTHSSEQILRHCDRAGLLDAGNMIGELDTPRAVVNRYFGLLAGNPITGKKSIDSFTSRPEYNPNEIRSGEGLAKFVDFRLKLPEPSNESLVIELDIEFHGHVKHPLYGLFIRTLDGVTLFATNSLQESALDSALPEQYLGDKVTVIFKLQPHLYAGDYFVSIAVSEFAHGEKIVLDRRHDAIHITVQSPVGAGGMIDMGPKISLRTLVEQCQ